MYSRTVAFLLLCSGALLSQSGGGYHLLRKVALGAAEVGGEYFDYITFDNTSRRVYLSHGTEIAVLDADTGRPAGKTFSASMATLTAPPSSTRRAENRSR